MKLQRNPSEATGSRNGRIGSLREAVLRRRMNVFNSLGSNYDAKSIWQALTLTNNPNYSKQLIDYLEKKYSGKAFLLYKNREALRLGLESLNLPPNTAVAICGFTCYVVDQAVIAAGLCPVYLDIDPHTLNFTPHALESAVKQHSHLKAVVVQNTLGYPADIQEIQKICQKHHLILIEDLAHSAGGKYESGQEIGKVGDMTVLSFSQDKSIDSVSGGVLISRRDIKDIQLKKISLIKQLQDRLYPLLTSSIRLLYSYKLGKYWHWFLKNIHALSVPMNPEDIEYQILPHWQAKLALEYFKKSSTLIEHRRQISQIYARQPQKIPYLRFPILVSNRDKLVTFLKTHGIYISDVWYDTPISPVDTCPNAEKIAETILNLPTHHHVTLQQAQKISHLINQWTNHTGKN